jgi:sec-independent protein translocase protein TatC
LFCYFFVLGCLFKFSGEFAPSSIVVTPDIENYPDFLKVPVVVIVVRMGIVSVAKLK